MSEYNNSDTQEYEQSAVWIRKTKTGDQYLSIKITIDGKAYNAVAFKNKNRKEGDKTPHFAHVNKKRDEAISEDDVLQG